jgi:hypothetical protein
MKQQINNMGKMNKFQKDMNMKNQEEYSIKSDVEN